MKSDDLTLQFVIMVDTSVSKGTIAAILASEFSDAQSRPDKSLDIRGNWVEILANEFADARKSRDPNEGYLYYALEIRATPLDKPVDEDHQVALAQDIRGAFLSRGFLAVVCANFENRL